MVMLGASIDERPVGLAVLHSATAAKAAFLESIFVDPAFRRRGVGRALLEAAESMLLAAGIPKLVGSWYHDAPAAAAIERLLADTGWGEPTPTATVYRGGRSALEQTVRKNRPWRPRPGFEIDIWSTLSPDERRQVDELGATHAIGMGLHPAGEWMLAVSEETSVVLRHHGEVAGWMLNHIVGAGLHRYSMLWIRPDLVGRGLGVSIVIESVRRHYALVDQLPRLFFHVEVHNDPMHRLIERRLGVFERYSSLLRSERSLVAGTAPSTRNVKDDRRGSGD